MEGERKSKGERGQGTGRWHTRGGRVVGGDRRIPSYGGDYRYAREDKGVEVQLLLFESFGGFGKGVREILRKAADVLQNKLTRAQYLDEVTWTTKNWLGLQKQRISVVLHTAIAEQIVNELACGKGGRVHELWWHAWPCCVHTGGWRLLVKLLPGRSATDRECAWALSI